jgi:cytochrome b561
MLSELQARAGEATHAMLLASLGVLTASGLGFAYFFGGGIKFFGLDAWPGAQGEAKNPAFAKQLFWVHSVTGQFLEYLVPVHIAGVFAGYAQGTNMLARMSPFAKNAKQAAAVVSK